MKTLMKLKVPQGFEITEADAYNISGGGVGDSFLNAAVGELVSWAARKFGYSISVFWGFGFTYAIDYASALVKFRENDPKGYTAYCNQYNKHQYCCNAMHAFDGLCPGNPYYQ